MPVPPEAGPPALSAPFTLSDADGQVTEQNFHSGGVTACQLRVKCCKSLLRAFPPPVSPPPSLPPPVHPSFHISPLSSPTDHDLVSPEELKPHPTYIPNDNSTYPSCTFCIHKWHRQPSDVAMA